MISRTLLFVLIVTLLAGRPASGGLTIDLTNGGGTAPSLTGTGSLDSVMAAAADVWELVFNGAGFDHSLAIEYRWAPFDGSILAAHSLVAEGGTPHRETAALILFDNDGSSQYFADGTLDPGDPLYNGNAEYATFTSTSQDFGGGSLNKGRVFTGASGPAAGRTDLFSVALHEIGHALGLSSANDSYQSESWPDNDIDVLAGLPFAGSVLPTNNTGTDPPGGSGFSSNAHLNISTALMYPFISSSVRRLPSAADILANAQLSQFSDPNLDLMAVPEPSAPILAALALAALTWARRRRARSRC